MTRLARAYVSPPSWARGPPGGICRHGVGADPLSTRPVHQAVEGSKGPVPCYQNSAREVARSSSSLHLPRSARLSSSTERGGVVAGVLCWKVMHAVVILSPAATALKENLKFSLKKINLSLIKSNIWLPWWHRVLFYMSKLTIGHIRNCSDCIPRWQEVGVFTPEGYCLDCKSLHSLFKWCSNHDLWDFSLKQITNDLSNWCLTVLQIRPTRTD